MPLNNIQLLATVAASNASWRSRCQVVFDKVGAIRKRSAGEAPDQTGPRECCVEILHVLPTADQAGARRVEMVKGAVTFGNFDGVHLGHRALLAQVVLSARRIGGPATVVTFDPHPLTLLRPDRAPRAVDSLTGRLERLAAAGVDKAWVLAFDAELASRSAEWFADEVLLGAAAAAEIVIGPDTRFGHQGLGDLQLLQAMASQRGAEVKVCAAALWAGTPVSSSRVRREIAAGQVREAAALLARPWSLDGQVVHGDQRGRTIGFPTANLEAPAQVQPAAGVYACRALLADGRAIGAVTNCGIRPTFGHAAWRVEAHLFDINEDIYGQTLRLEFLERLRGEVRFASVADLVAQIAEDARQARAVVAEWPVPAGRAL